MVQYPQRARRPDEARIRGRPGHRRCRARRAGCRARVEPSQPLGLARRPRSGLPPRRARGSSSACGAAKLVGLARTPRVARRANSRMVSSIQKRSPCGGRGSCRPATERVEVGVADLLGCFERAAAARRRRGARRAAAPPRRAARSSIDRRPQRLLAWVGVAAAAQQVEALRQALEELLGREHACAGGCELEREREVVEPAQSSRTARRGSTSARTRAPARRRARRPPRSRQRRHGVRPARPRRAAARGWSPAAQVRATRRAAPQTRRAASRPARGCRADEQQPLVADVARRARRRRRAPGGDRRA